MFSHGNDKPVSPGVFSADAARDKRQITSNIKTQIELCVYKDFNCMNRLMQCNKNSTYSCWHRTQVGAFHVQ